MRWTMTLALVAALLLPVAGLAQVGKTGEQVPRVAVLYGQQSGTTITAAAPIEMSSTAKYTDTYALPRTMAHSVGLTLVSTQAITAAVEVQGSLDGTNWKSFQPAVSLTSTGSTYVTTSLDKIMAISLPVAPYVRVKFTPDAPGPNRYYTVTQCWIGAW